MNQTSKNVRAKAPTSMLGFVAKLLSKCVTPVALLILAPFAQAQDYGYREKVEIASSMVAQVSGGHGTAQMITDERGAKPATLDRPIFVAALRREMPMFSGSKRAEAGSAKREDFGLIDTTRPFTR